MSNVKRHMLYASHVAGGMVMIESTPELRAEYPQALVYVGAKDFDRVTAERDALQLLLNERDEQLHELEQRRRAEFDNGQAAVRRVEELEKGLKWETERNALLLAELKAAEGGGDEA